MFGLAFILAKYQFEMLGVGYYGDEQTTVRMADISFLITN